MQKARQSVHSRRMQAIRPYVNFNYNLRKPLTAHAKAKIKKYFDEIEALKARNHVIYRPRRADRLKAAQEFAQHENHLPGLRAAFIPVANPATAKLKVGRGRVPRFTVKEVRGIERVSIPLRPRALIKDTAAEIGRALSKEPKATHFAIQAGKYEISHALGRERVLPRVRQLMERYSEGGAKFKASRRSSNHWKEWMHGINAYFFPDQEPAGMFMQKKIEAGRAHRKRRKRCKVANCNRRAIRNGKCAKHQ